MTTRNGTPKIDWRGLIECTTTIVTAIATIVLAYGANRIASESNGIAAKSNQLAEYVTKTEQLNHVAAWIHQDKPGEGYDVVISNASDLPVYDVFVGASLQTSYDNPKPAITKCLAEYHGTNYALGTVAPGKWRVRIGMPSPSMSHRLGATVVFRDTEGRVWVRDANGKVAEIKQNPVDYVVDPRHCGGGLPYGLTPMEKYTD
ncbi:hypothetical protein [Bifidobacterium myosotis]|uniref:Uncharacterized protein n=1 Tax=Bifidobacterium myosotis TaxID=1630166 RepID=A0A5M9ZFZ3_9BIFI|nr:hypothetical protein [Bifidobacterium myosotis]KAA8825104.1 hypothetical protein EMO91_12815 [Bifidobacterium myosotis]